MIKSYPKAKAYVYRESHDKIAVSIWIKSKINLKKISFLEGIFSLLPLNIKISSYKLDILKTDNIPGPKSQTKNKNLIIFQR